ncbi:Mannosyltransferase related to Gpi18 [Paenibacillus catalpae]|uniref:Mannosyltransferase related to Gpi18 n=1 Tax=Paenibacillus catalpae TaxID=1045775 RepID=A0A1I2HRJ6_9BACL|nr:glycosyltransferase family 39 protein [Paenibacillus catalpae]SFF32158.1 Mannosyltransferase related to Gpi18 [Paenibacillus catalpae]
MWKSGLRAIICLLFVIVVGLLPAINGYAAAEGSGAAETNALGNIATEAFSPIISMEPVQSASATPQEQEKVDPKKISAFSVLAISALFGALFAYLYSRWLRAREFSAAGQLEVSGSKPSTNGMRIALLAAFAFRFYIAATNPGYTNDINTFIFWANHAFKDGLGNFYQEGLFADYPPGYIYVLYVLGALQSWTGIGSGSDAAIVFYKLPAIFADLISGYLIYRTAVKKLDHRAAFGLAMLYIWNPAVWMNSAGWGQVDSFFALILILAVRAITERKLERASIWFAIAVLVKPQALIFTPVFLLAYGYNLKSWKRIAAGIGYGAVTFLLLAAPFIWNNGGLHALYNLYRSTLSSYPYATLNAFNLYALTGGNWAKLDAHWLGVEYAAWGNIGIVFATVVSILFFAFRKQQKDLSGSFYMAIILIVTVFMFAAKMHERYMFPALLLMIFAYIEARDRRILHLLLGFSITHFINVGYVLAFSQANAFLPSSNGILIVTSLCNVGLYVYMLYVGYDRYIKGRQLPVHALTKAELALSEERLLQEVRDHEQPARRLQRKDWLWMSIITVVYAAIALVNLGSTVSIDSGWKADRDGQSFYVDFGKPVQISQVNSFNGVGVGNYKWEFSSTPDQWSNPIEIEQKVGDNLKWTVNPVNQTVRYAKLTVTKRGFTMQEVAFYSEGSDRPVPIQQVVDTAESNSTEEDAALVGSRLFDEQSNAVYKPNYMNNSYFDEIYHARTAYENLHGIKAYENTHPPLGKLLIAVGIKLFGLSPFGWRIVGTLFGVAMLPIIYLFALQLFRKTGYAATATILLAADFMHFTQTRIATIDVYGVFFIMLMFYFMNKYREMSFYRSPLWKTLVPLFWAGLLFGIGVASKWIVIYGGAGLAVMLALVLIERYREQAAARRVLARIKEGDVLPEEEVYRKVSRGFVRNTVLTLASCVVFFVVIPLAIYCLSYIPVLSVKGDTFTAERLIEYQKHMYDYHSNLVATHPYSSQWWEWPFMKRPVWYYNGKNLEPGQISSISSFGNPLIWWTGIFAVIAALYISVKRKDKRMYVLWIAYLSQYLPWMLVPRLTFLYHYFAMVPFMILAIVYIFTRIEEGRENKRWIRWVYAGIAVVLFIMYYPVISGMEVSKDYVMIALRHFDSWVFYS